MADDKDVKGSRRDSILGAIVGVLIGDALGLGCHWYYEMDSFKADYGEWISYYTDSKPDRRDRFGHIAKYRYETGLRKGDLSQTGQVALLLLESVAERGSYVDSDFTARLDSLLNTLDGTPLSGRYTDWAMRDVWRQRKSGLPWTQVGSMADTTEAAIRSVVLSARFFKDPEFLARTAHGNILLTHRDTYVSAQSLAYSLAVAALIQGIALKDIVGHLSSLHSQEPIMRLIPSYDCLVQAGNGARAFSVPVRIEPASLICSIYGLPCALGFVLPAAYYLIHRFPASFESAVLSAVNGGGNNMARAALTGALSGAMVGLKDIPERFVTGLRDHERILSLAGQVAAGDGTP
ncbi:MAG: ADP-ribosylglycohydrolase family protein [Thermodesulfobacteriota bacterium]